MKIFCLIVALCLPFLEASAQSPSPSTGSAGKPQARLIDTLKNETSSQVGKRQVYTATQLEEEFLNKRKDVPSKITVEGILNIVNISDHDIKFNDVIFENDLSVRGKVKSIRFDHCQFKQNVDFYDVESDSLRISNCKFSGSVWFVIKLAKTFELRKCEFEKIVDFGNSNFQQTYTVPGDPRPYNTAITMTRLISRQPIRIDWAQFGERWLKEMREGAAKENLPLVDLQRELEFWKNNFNALGHERAANEVNYEINLLGTEGVRVQSPFDRWKAKLMSIPNRYGTEPYRPLVAGSLIILLFAAIYRIADPFVPAEKVTTPKPRTPLLLFSLMYSIDTFIPVIDVTKVREWGWQTSPAFRWVTVTERLLGLVVFYSATYSLAYYIF